MRIRLFGHYGSKHYVLKHMIPLLPARIGDYYEPFLGAGTLFWHLAQHDLFERAYISDLDVDLMHAYKTLYDAPDTLIDKVLALIGAYHASPRQFCEEIRTRLKLQKRDLNHAADYIMAKWIGFAYRVRMSKPMVVEYNKATLLGTSPRLNLRLKNKREKIVAAAEVLASVAVNIQTRDYVSIVPRAGDFVYLDPPYIITDQGYDYSFSTEDFVRFCVQAERWARQGINVMVSYKDMHGLDECLPSFKVRRFTVYCSGHTAPGVPKKYMSDTIATNYEAA